MLQELFDKRIIDYTMRDIITMALFIFVIIIIFSFLKIMSEKL